MLRSAKNGSRWTIGILCDAVNEWYQNTVFLGATDALRELGATVVMFNGGIIRSPDITETDRNALFDLVDPSRIDGLVVVAPVADEIGAQALSAFCWRYAQLPVCSLALELPGRPGVVVDNLGGMGKLVEHMVLDHGRRRVAFVRGPVANPEAEGRYGMYRAILKRHGVPFDPALVVTGDFRAPSGAEAVRVLVDERRVDFDAVVAANDNMALGVMEALQARGISVPGAVGVAGFDDMEEGRFATPPLTTVSQPIYESARQASRLLVAMLRNEIGPARVTLGTRLVLRESCGCTVDDAVASRGPTEFVAVRSVAEHLASRRKPIVESLKRAVPAEQSRIPADWPEPIFDAYLADLVDPASQRFVPALHATFRRVIAAGGSLRPWHAAVSVLRTGSMGVVGDPAGLARARELLHRVRVLIGDLRERFQAHHRIQREHWIRRLHETSEAFTRSFGEDALVEAVASQLPRWKIPASAIVLYDRSGRKPLTRARPLFLYDDHRRLPCDPNDTFASHELAPAGWLDARQRTVIAEPLVFRGEQFGFSLFEVGPLEGEVYEGMRRLLSSAMKGSRLVAQVVDGATERQRAEQQRLEKEMEIAARIQTSLVQKTVGVPGLDIAAVMIPATEVGGDYYDVVPFAEGCWLGVGDVAGHGLQTGLVMLIIQSVVSALVRDSPHASPLELVRTLNSVMFESVRRRMGQDEHATLLLLRYEQGRVVHSGAHEEVVVFRAAQGRCERIETMGPVLGAVADVGGTLSEGNFDLGLGDVMVLYTDGLTDAMNTAGLTFGVEKVCAIIEATAGGSSAHTVLDAILRGVRAWTSAPRDDISVLVVRRTA